MISYSYHRSLSRANLTDYVNLFSSSFSGAGKLNLEYLNWLYCKNPHGEAIGWDAFMGDKLIAHYAVIPRKYSFLGQEYAAALSVNTATHPEHQGRGLFVNLANRTYESAHAFGTSFIVGIANANSIGGFIKKLDFTALGQVGLFLSFNSIRKESSKLDLINDAEWINWRLSNPSRKYTYSLLGNGALNIRTEIKGITFNLGYVDNSIFQKTKVSTLTKRESVLLPALTPYFQKGYHSIFRIPYLFYPSPWHVIWRTLDKSIDQELADKLLFSGLSMDTF